MVQRGALNPAHVRHGRHRGNDRAFVPDPSNGAGRITDDLAEALAESYVATAISGEEQTADTLDDFVPEELGGPFVPEDSSPDLGLRALQEGDDAKFAEGLRLRGS